MTRVGSMDRSPFRGIKFAARKIHLDSAAKAMGILWIKTNDILV